MVRRPFCADENRQPACRPWDAGEHNKSQASLTGLAWLPLWGIVRTTCPGEYFPACRDIRASQTCLGRSELDVASTFGAHAAYEVRTRGACIQSCGVYVIRYLLSGIQLADILLHRQEQGFFIQLFQQAFGTGLHWKVIRATEQAGRVKEARVFSPATCVWIPVKGAGSTAVPFSNVL